MTEQISRSDLGVIYDECRKVYLGIFPADDPLEDRIEWEYGSFGAFFVMPWLFEMVERGMSKEEAIALSIPKNVDEITEKEFIHFVVNARTLCNSQLEENEEETIKPSETTVAPPLKKKSPKVRVKRARTSGSLSARAWDVYERLYTKTPDIRNVEAQQVIVSELNITCTKQKNSLRALVVKFKKELKG